MSPLAPQEFASDDVKPVLEFRRSHAPLDGRKTVMSDLPSPSESPATTRVTTGPGPVWLMLKDCPPIAIDPFRAVVPVLAATVYVTVPKPLPLMPELIVIHPAPLAALQVQPVVVVTVIVPLPPRFVKSWLAGDSA